MQRKDEILAKKAKLAELRRQREEREQRQKEARRESVLDDGSGVKVPTPQRSTDRQELDSFIETLVGERPGSRGPGTGTASPAGRKSRPSSTLSNVQVGAETYEQARANAAPSSYVTASTQTSGSNGVQLSTAQAQSVKKSPIDTYEKAVQTSDEWSQPRRRISAGSDSDSGYDASPAETLATTRAPSRKQREMEEELRQNLRREIEEELKAAQDLSLNGQDPFKPSKFPARGLSTEELNAVTSSDDFVDFVERSSKVIEKALDQDYDVLANYALDGLEDADEDEDETYGSLEGKRGRRIKQTSQFWDERWSKKRMISDLSFSPKVRLLPSFDDSNLTRNSFLSFF